MTSIADDRLLLRDLCLKIVFLCPTRLTFFLNLAYVNLSSSFVVYQIVYHNGIFHRFQSSISCFFIAGAVFDQYSNASAQLFAYVTQSVVVLSVLILRLISRASR